MQRKKALALAVSSALPPFDGAAHAGFVTKDDFSTADTAEVFISGSSGQDTGIVYAVARLCLPGTMTEYDNSSNQRAMICSVDTSQVIGLGAGITKMVVYKSSDGGSGNGVTPLVAPGSNVSFLSMASIKANTATQCTASPSAKAAIVSGGATLVPNYQT